MRIWLVGTGRTKRRTPRVIRSLWSSKLALCGLIVLCLILLAAIFAPLLAPHDPQLITLKKRHTPPAWTAEGSSEHFLGTDSLGRDLLSRVIYGARISIVVGLSTVLIAGCLGVVSGLIAGFYGGRTDDVFMRLADIQLSFPSIVLYIAVLALAGAGLSNMILVLGLTGWVTYARVVRGQVMSLREHEFVDAARTIGASNRRIIGRHILPNITGPILVLASTSVAGMIIAEAALSFLGLGVPPDVPSWGSMLSEGREYIRTAWWLAVFPGLAIMFTVLGINTVGDWLRDYFDPRLRI